MILASVFGLHHKLSDGGGEFRIEYVRFHVHAGNVLPGVARLAERLILAGGELSFSEAADQFSELIELGLEDDVSFQQAGIFAQRGNADLAIHHLNKAFDLGDQGMTQLKINQFLDPLRDDPRYNELLEKVGFEPSRHP